MTDQTDKEILYLIELIRRLAMLLDATLPTMEKAADAERQREQGKNIRQITKQKRFEAAKEIVTEAERYLQPPTVELVHRTRD